MDRLPGPALVDSALLHDDALLGDMEAVLVPIHGLVEGHIHVREAQGGADQEATRRGRDQGQDHRHGGEVAIGEGLAPQEVLGEGDEAQATVATVAIVKGAEVGAGIGLVAGGDPGTQLSTCTLP